MNRTAGVVSVLIDGIQIDVVGNVEYRVSATRFEPLVGADSHVAHKELNDPGYIAFEFRNRSDLDIKALIEGEPTVTVNLRNGKQIVGSELKFTGDPVANTEEANVPARWDGLVEEQVAA